MIWYTKTNNGWFERINVAFSNEEKQILNSENPQRLKLLETFKSKATKKINPPQLIQDVFSQFYDANWELILANINNQGHGTIYTKKVNQYHKITF